MIIFFKLSLEFGFIYKRCLTNFQKDKSREVLDKTTEFSVPQELYSTQS
jgi:hypothetical protein